MSLLTQILRILRKHLHIITKPMSEFIIDKATGEEFEKAPATLELTCRTGFENIKGQENEEGKNDYLHVKMDKRYVTYKVVGCHTNEEGQISMSLRKVLAKTTGVNGSIGLSQEKRDELELELEGINDDINSIEGEKSDMEKRKTEIKAELAK